VPLVLTNAGELVLLRWLLKETNLTAMTFSLHLFKNNITVNRNTVVGDFTEATFGSYAAKALTRANWTSPVTVSDKALSTYTSTAQQWSSNGGAPETIYGYYITDDDTGTALWAENFAQSRIVAEFDTIDVLPVATLDSEFNP